MSPLPIKHNPIPINDPFTNSRNRANRRPNECGGTASAFNPTSSKLRRARASTKSEDQGMTSGGDSIVHFNAEKLSNPGRMRDSLENRVHEEVVIEELDDSSFYQNEFST